MKIAFFFATFVLLDRRNPETHGNCHGTMDTRKEHIFLKHRRF